MKLRFILYIVATLLFTVALPSPSKAQGVITVRLSYKIILNPADGTRPPRGAGNPAVADADIDTAINAINTLYNAYFRGYRVQRVDLIDIGGKGDDQGPNPGPSRWYNTNFFASDGGDMKNQLEAAAVSDARYRWNPTALNIYIVNGFCGGLCSLSNRENVILIGACSATSGAVQLHEIGHFFGLCHTQGCGCACGNPTCGTCSSAPSPDSCTSPGDDGIADTLPDLPCWDQNAIARNQFGGRNYAQLNAGEQSLVDDAFFNLMSYHGTCCSVGGSQTRLTELQLDRWADFNFYFRSGICDGFTFFVDHPMNRAQDGTSGFPFQSVIVAVDKAITARGNDILMLRPGAYNERLTIKLPAGTSLTLRATLRGPAVIGSATAAARSAGPAQEEIDRTLRETPGIFDVERPHMGFPGKGPKPPQ